MTLFVLDTNFFIQAHRANYPFDVAINFWLKVKELAEAEKIISIDKVKKEIFDNEDALKNWCQDNLPKDFFKDTSCVLKQYADVVKWTTTNNASSYLPKAITEFLEADKADAWLVAYALEDKGNRIIVTQEISNPQRKSKIQIPDVCNNLAVKYTNTIGMFRLLGESF